MKQSLKMRALDGWYGPRFLAFSERKAVTVCELGSPPATSKASRWAAHLQTKKRVDYP